MSPCSLCMRVPPASRGAGLWNAFWNVVRSSTCYRILNDIQRRNCVGANGSLNSSSSRNNTYHLVSEVLGIIQPRSPMHAIGVDVMPSRILDFPDSVSFQDMFCHLLDPEFTILPKPGNSPLKWAELGRLRVAVGRNGPRPVEIGRTRAKCVQI